MEDLHDRRAARPGRDDDLGVAVAGEVGRRDADATQERRVGGPEGANLGARQAVEGPDVRAGAGAGTDHDVGRAIGGEVARGDVHAAPERRRVGEEVVQHGAVGGAVDAHPRLGSRSGADDEVGQPVGVDVADRDVQAARPGDRRRELKISAPLAPLNTLTRAAPVAVAATTSTTRLRQSPTATLTPPV